MECIDLLEGDPIKVFELQVLDRCRRLELEGVELTWFPFLEGPGDQDDGLTRYQPLSQSFLFLAC